MHLVIFLTDAAALCKTVVHVFAHYITHLVIFFSDTAGGKIVVFAHYMYITHLVIFLSDTVCYQSKHHLKILFSKKNRLCFLTFPPDIESCETSGI